MRFKHRAWIPVAWILSLGNLVAVWFAAEPAEPWHATIHALLAVAFALGAQRLATRRRVVTESDRLQDSVEGIQPRLEELEERVDFAERLLAKQRDADRLDAQPR